MPYATIGDIYAKAIGPGAFVSRPRDIVLADPVANVLTLPNHGLSPLQVITFVVEGVNTPGGYGMPVGYTSPSLPSGLSPSVIYYPIPVSSDLFQIATTPSGSPVALGSAGVPKFGVRVDAAYTLNQLLISTAAFPLDEVLTDYDPPIKPDPVTGLYPEVLVTVNALLAAQAAIPVFGIAHPQYEKAVAAALMGWNENVKDALKRWYDGRYINVHPDGQNSGMSENSARFGRGRRNRGMNTRIL